MSAVLELQVEALLARVRRQRDAECAAATRDAERQVAALLADAQREAHARLRAAAREKRERVAERCRQAIAAAETAGRSAEFAQERALLLRAAAALPLALATRWRDAMQRSAWARAAFRLAARRLVSREWRIVAAPDLGDDERAALLAFAVELGARATFDADADGDADAEPGEAGLIIFAPGARLDATVHGLLADRHEIEARVLAELRRGRHT